MFTDTKALFKDFLFICREKDFSDAHVSQGGTNSHQNHTSAQGSELKKSFH